MTRIYCDACGSLADEVWSLECGRYCGLCVSRVADGEWRRLKAEDPFLSWLYARRSERLYGEDDYPRCDCPARGQHYGDTHEAGCKGLAFAARVKYKRLSRFTTREIESHLREETDASGSSIGKRMEGNYDKVDKRLISGYGVYQDWQSDKWLADAESWESRQWLKHNKAAALWVQRAGASDIPDAVARIGAMPPDEAAAELDRLRESAYRAKHPRKREEMPRRLTAEQVVAIRERYASGEATQRGLAVEYGISQAMCAQVIYGSVYKDAGGPVLSLKWGGAER